MSQYKNLLKIFVLDEDLGKRDITNLCSDIKISTSIFDININILFIFHTSSLLKYELKSNDNIEVEIYDYSQNKIKHSMTFKIFSLRYASNTSNDKEDMNLIVDGIDIHSFYLHIFSESKVFDGDISDMIKRYMMAVFDDNNISKLPIKWNMEMTNISYDDFMTLKTKPIKEIKSLVGSAKKMILFRRWDEINFRNIIDTMKLWKNETPIIDINEKVKNQTQLLDFNFEYNFDFFRAYQYGLYGYNIYEWNKEKNLMEHYFGDVITEDVKDTFPVIAGNVQPNAIFNFGYCMNLKDTKLHKIGDTVSFTSLKNDSSLNGRYVIIECVISYMQEKNTFSYKLFKL